MRAEQGGAWHGRSPCLDARRLTDDEGWTRLPDRARHSQHADVAGPRRDQKARVGIRPESQVGGVLLFNTFWTVTCDIQPFGNCFPRYWLRLATWQLAAEAGRKGAVYDRRAIAQRRIC